MNEADLNKRLIVLIIAIGVLMLVLAGRLFYLQIIRGDQFTEIARFNISRTSYIPAPRGEIRDRFGNVIAYDIPRLNVCAIPSEIQNLKLFSRALAPLINYPPGQIIKIIEKNRDNPYQKVTIKPRVDTETMMKVTEIQGDLPGLYLEVQPVREYPRGESACHIIGYVGEITEQELKTSKSSSYKMGDFIGKDGIEKQYDFYLRGKYGERHDIVDASGKIIQTIIDKKPQPGKNIILTIDIKLQEQVEEILKWHVRSLSAICGERLAAAAVIEDVKTGEILAMVSIPGFDPNLFSKGMTTKEYEALVKRRDYPLLNRPIAGSYPLASTFKVIVALGALQEGICTRYSPFFCPGYYDVGNKRFHCFVKSGHGKIDFNESISESCDVAFYFLGESLGIDRLLKYSRKFGLGQKTGIDLPGETPGLLPDHYWKLSNLKEPWYTGDTINLSIGQGYLASTPLQLAVITSTIAQDGIMYKAHLLKRIESTDGKTLKLVEPQVSNVLKINKKHFDAVKDALYTAVTKGTADRLDSRISAAGKTGTAESFPCPENPNGRNHTWFTGYTPAYDPKITFVVFFERSGGYAGKRAVPIANEILDAYTAIENERNLSSRKLESR